ncbi:unnamed protein product [Peniophora sp. CBMAI 1063]|nr:unnamed protein product [Peniophora sp. CBMAI 1063]
MFRSHLYRLHSFARLEPLNPDAACFAPDCSTEYKGSVFLHDHLDGWYIGRGLPGIPCDVPILDEKVATSSIHAVIYRIKRQNGDWKVYLKALSRTSTTWVNSRDVAEGEVVELHDSAEIWLGYIDGQTSSGIRYLDLYSRRSFLRDNVFEMTLGSGAFGEVHKVHSRSAPHLKSAVKVLDFGRRGGVSEWDAKVEIAIVKDLLNHNHQHIVPLFSIHDDEDHAEMYMYTMEFLPYGDLHHVLESRPQFLNLDEIFVVMLQLLSALSCLHNMGIVHRDVKLLNILVKSSSPWWILLADFGTAKRISATYCGSEVTKSTVGTRHYVAPEVTLDPQGYGSSADVYSSGVAMFLMLQGELDLSPYRFSNPPVTFRDHVKYRSIAWDRLQHRDLDTTVNGRKALKLVRGLLETNPRDRFKISKAISQLRGTPIVESRDLAGNKTQPGISPSLRRLCEAMGAAMQDAAAMDLTSDQDLCEVVNVGNGRAVPVTALPPVQVRPQPRPRNVKRIACATALPASHCPEPSVVGDAKQAVVGDAKQAVERGDAAGRPSVATPLRRSPRQPKTKRAPLG